MLSAAALVASAGVLGFVIDPPAASLGLLLAAIAIAAWKLGRAAAITAALLSAVTACVVLLRSDIRSPEVVVQLAIFLTAAFSIVLATWGLGRRPSADSQSDFLNTPFPALVITPEGSILAANTAAVASYGFASSEFCEMTLSQLGAELEPAASRNTADPISVVKHRRKDGSEFYVELVERHTNYKGDPARIVYCTDVTERFRASDAYQSREARLTEVFGNCPVSLAVTRWSDHRFVDVNREFSELTGWEPEDIVGRTAVECGLVSQPDSERLQAHLSVHHTLMDREIEITTRSGKRRTVAVGAVIGEFAGERATICSVVDITELRRAEERRKTSDDRLVLVTEKARVGLIMINDRRRVTFHNSAYGELFGLKTESINGRRISEVHPELYDRQIAPGLDRAFAGNSFEFELRQPTRGGDRYFDVRYEPNLSGSVVESVVAVITETTDRVRAERRLEASEQQYRTLFEYLPDGIYIASADSKYVDANETFCRMLGYDRRELIGRSTTEIFVPREVPHLGQTLYGLNSDLEYYQDWEYRRKDGSIVAVEVFASVMPDGNTLAVVRDIADRRHLEAQLLQAQKMEAIGVLAGGVAHDFNNILTAISGYTELAMEEAAASKTLSGYLAEVASASQRAAALTNQLLTFSRREPLSRDRVHDLNSVINDTERMLRRIVKENIEFDIRCSADLDLVRIDPGQLTQIIVNLAVNSGDAMSGGGRLTITTRNVTLDGDLAREGVVVVPGRYVELAVSDNGCGMDEQTRHRLFEPFYTTKSAGKGTGLGLSTVYGIVKGSGGDILVESAPGAGTTMRLYIPAVTGLVTTHVAREALRASFVTSGTILVVEDEKSVRELVKGILERNGYKVIAASAPAEALSVCRSYDGHIDLLLTDMVMPGMDGAELSVSIAQMRSDIRTIIMSGYAGDPVDKTHQAEPGAMFIAKPFSPEELLHAIDQALADKEEFESISYPRSPSGIAKAASH